VGQHQVVPLAKRHHLAPKRQGSGGGGGVVGITQHHHPRLLEDHRGNIGELGQKAGFGPEWHGVNLPVGQVDAPGVGGVARIHEQGKIAGVENGQGQMGRALLGANQQQYLGFSIDRDAKLIGIPAGGGPTKILGPRK
jgi:hypothetical protein